MKKTAKALKKPLPAMPPALDQLLNTYAFPGNPRELEAMVFDAVARHQGTILSPQSLREIIHATADIAPAPADAWLNLDPLPTLQLAEERLVADALHRADGTQGVAAGRLGISRQALNKRLSRQRQADDRDDD